MIVIDTQSLDEKANNLSNSEIYWTYCGLDCCVTYDVKLAIEPQLDDIARETYQTSLDTVPVVLEMMLGGFKVDVQKRREVLAFYEKQLEKLESRWIRLCSEGLGIPADRAKRVGERRPLPINPASPKDIQFLFHTVLQIPEKKKRKKGKDEATVTTDREVLESFRAYYFAEVFVNHILAMRDAAKSIGFLKTKLDEDNRIRCSFNVAGTKTGRLSSSFSDTGTGCVRPTAEALTPTGWKKLADLKDGDLIAQWDNGTLSFVPATFYRRHYEGKLLWVTGEQMNLAMTPGHRVVYSTYGDPTIRVASASELANRACVLVPISGEMDGYLEMPTYLPMLMADASKEGTVWRAAWKKKRKIDRFLALAKTHNLRFSEGVSKPDYRRFTIYADISLPKKWGPWVLDLTLENAKALVEESKHWDSHVRGKSFIFYTADKEQATWYQILCHRAGYGTTWHSAQNRPDAYGNQSTIYSIAVKPRKHVQLMQKHWSTFDYSGEICCPQVPSSYWLVREGMQIMVTGNTNLQNITGKLKNIFVADPGEILLDIDLEQGDSRGVGAIAWNWFVESHGEAWAGAYLDACESGDLHTTVARMVWGGLPWPADLDPKACRKVAEQPAYRDKSYRDLSKALSHGSNYLGQPPTMAQHTKLPVSTIAEFQKNYFSAFPCITAWQQETLRQLSENRCLITPFGRRRWFWDDPNAQTTKNAAIAYSPQSTTGEFINRGAIKLQRYRNLHNLPIRFILQVHDSLVLAVKWRRLEELIPIILRELKVVLPLARGREFTIPHGVKVGWNYGPYDPHENPYGLRKWTGHEDRTPPKELTTLQAALNSPLKTR